LLQCRAGYFAGQTPEFPDLVIDFQDGPAGAIEAPMAQRARYFEFRYRHGSLWTC
jgi:hypothetical protein